MTTLVMTSYNNERPRLLQGPAWRVSQSGYGTNK